MTLRVLTKDDWPLWRALRLAALSDAPHAFQTRLSDWNSGEEERWRARLEIPGAYHVVAVLNGQAVGMASGIPADDGARELKSVWVSSEARGRGIGNRLLTAVETWARESGAVSLKLAVLPDNEPAIALYQRNGFVATGDPGDLLSDGTTREHIMAKALRPA